MNAKAAAAAAPSTASKRLRRGSDGGWSRAGPPMPELPSEIWAVEVAEFLPFSDLIRLSSVDRRFLREVAPIVRQEIFVFSPDEMSPMLGSRFKSVHSVNILCLVSMRHDPDNPDDPHWYDRDLALCDDTARRVVPFLSRFSGLESVCVGGLEDSKEPWNNWVSYDAWKCVEPSNHCATFNTLIEDFCEAFRAGALAKDLGVEGIVSSIGNDDFTTFRCAPEDEEEHPEGGCDLCRDICHSFPLKHVVGMDCKDPWFDDEQMMWHIRNIEISFPRNGSLCLSSRERISIIASRPGGREILSEEGLAIAFERRVSLASEAVRVDENGAPSAVGTYFVCSLDFPSEMIDEVEAVLHFVDALSFDYYALEKHVVSPYWRRTKGLPGRGKLYIMKDSFDHLVKLGLRLNIDDFRCVVRRNREVVLGPGWYVSGGYEGKPSDVKRHEVYWIDMMCGWD